MSQINKKLHYDEPTLHYPSITEPTLHYPLITMYTVIDYIQEYSKATKQQKSNLTRAHLRGSIGARASADPCAIWGPKGPFHILMSPWPLSNILGLLWELQWWLP